MDKKQFLDETGLEVLIKYIAENYMSVVKVGVDNFSNNANKPFTSSQLKNIIDSYNTGKTVLIKDHSSNWIHPTIQIIDQISDYGNNKMVKIIFPYNNSIHEISQSVSV